MCHRRQSSIDTTRYRARRALWPRGPAVRPATWRSKGLGSCYATVGVRGEIRRVFARNENFCASFSRGLRPGLSAGRACGPFIPTCHVPRIMAGGGCPSRPRLCLAIGNRQMRHRYRARRALWPRGPAVRPATWRSNGIGVVLRHGRRSLKYQAIGNRQLWVSITRREDCFACGSQ
jgi:hypothetical protein